MKSYLLILFSTLGLSFLISSYNPEVAKNTLEMVPEASQQIEANLLSEKDQISKVDVTEVAASADITAAYTSTPKTTTSTSGSNRGQSYAITKVDTSGTVKDPGNDIHRSNKLVYAHNSAQLFGNLKYLGKNSSFSLTENGITTSYQVQEVKFFKKLDATTLVLCYNNDLNDCHGQNQISNVVNGRYINESSMRNSYSIAVMTCEGSGNTPYRRIIFAN